MERSAVLQECKETLEALDFTPCFMVHENFVKNRDGRVKLNVITQQPEIGAQCPAHIQERRPHCNHTDNARRIMIGVAQRLRALGVLSPNQRKSRAHRIRRIGREQEAYDAEGRGYIYHLPIDEFGTNPEMEEVRCRQDGNRARLERISVYLLGKIDDALAQAQEDSNTATISE